MSQQECTNFFDVHLSALHNKCKGLPVFNSATHNACVLGREGRGEFPSHFEPYSRVSTSELLFKFWSVINGTIKIHKFTYSWIKRDQRDVTCFFISLFNAQYVSDVNTSIIRSLRLICWVISWIVFLWYVVCWCYVVVWLVGCGIRMQAEALLQPASGTTQQRERMVVDPVNQYQKL